MQWISTLWERRNSLVCVMQKPQLRCQCSSSPVSFPVNFAEKPGAPRNLRVIEARARSVLLDFTPGSSGRAPILTYTVQYNNDSFYPVSAQWKTLMVVQDAHLVWNLLPLTLPNLKPYSDYRFRVIAKNKVGSSNPSNASDTVRTLETGKKTTN